MPEFVYGYIPVDNDGKLGEIIHNPNYTETHDLDNVNLMYENSAVIKARKKGIELKKQEVGLDVKYQILVKAYKETKEKYGNRQAEYALLELIKKNDVQYFTGQNNRNNLKKYVCFANILKIMSFGVDIEKKDENSIISNFCNQINQVDNNKKII